MNYLKVIVLLRPLMGTCGHCCIHKGVTVLFDRQIVVKTAYSMYLKNAIEIRIDKTNMLS